MAGQQRSTQEFEVEYWVVCHDREIPEGMLRGAHLSALFEARGQAVKALEVIRAEHQDARIGRGVFYFLDHEVALRDELVSEIQRAGEMAHG